MDFRQDQRSCARQLEPEGAASSLHAANAQLAIQRSHDSLGKSEPDSGAFDIGSFGPEPFKWYEEPLHLFLRNAVAGVGNADPPAVWRLFSRAAADDHTAVGAVIFHRIGQEIQQHL